LKALGLTAVTVLALGCSTAGGGTAAGLTGLVKRGPITPVCRVGVPCDEPARGVKLYFFRSSKVAATATTNAKGWYRVTLRPGRYSVRLLRRGPAMAPEPSSVTVPNDRVKRRDFHIDTGIR
jgi:hypothetical protein